MDVPITSAYFVSELGQDLPLSAFSTSHLHGEDLLHSGTAKRGTAEFLASLIISVTLHHSPKPPHTPFGSLFIPNSSHVSDHLQHLLLSHFSLHPDEALQMQELSHAVKLLSTSVKAFE